MWIKCIVMRSKVSSLPRDVLWESFVSGSRCKHVIVNRRVWSSFASVMRLWKSVCLIQINVLEKIFKESVDNLGNEELNLKTAAFFESRSVWLTFSICTACICNAVFISISSNKCPWHPNSHLQILTLLMKQSEQLATMHRYAKGSTPRRTMIYNKIIKHDFLCF